LRPYPRSPGRRSACFRPKPPRRGGRARRANGDQWPQGSSCQTCAANYHTPPADKPRLNPHPLSATAMAHEAAAFDATLTAAAGEDLALLAELRSAFVESLTQQLDLLQIGRASCRERGEVT